MTEEEFFINFAEMAKSFTLPAFDIFLWVAAVIFATCVCTVGYIALGDAWKEVRRRYAQRAHQSFIEINPPPPPTRRKRGLRRIK